MLDRNKRRSDGGSISKQMIVLASSIYDCVYWERKVNIDVIDSIDFASLFNQFGVCLPSFLASKGDLGSTYDTFCITSGSF